MQQEPIRAEAPNIINLANSKEGRIMDNATPVLDLLNSGISRPQLNTLHFELKPIMFHMLQTNGQFGGLPSEDPHAHLKSFMELSDAFLIPGVSSDYLRLTFFGSNDEMTIINQHNTALRNLETQVSQLAQQQANRAMGTLPSNTEVPKAHGKEHIKTITLGDGMTLGEPVFGPKQNLNLKKCPKTRMLHQHLH
ncbi:hypothetical protein OSB04_016893 [Centaurea solstitialis]|uniref:Uncharacterized protein n=1 Tax=Centaurea solstitialis TaxID=347529 RepID=A0AA38TLW9_9ASTR|nr:hypothetical protein OSB04_016893 [Centaurea solstitialis]